MENKKESFINSPEILDNTYCLKSNKNIYFAGQITGVEGYVESISSGLVAGLNAVSKENKIIFPNDTMIGALANYISTENKHFQPMNANFGILPQIENNKTKDKKLKYGRLADKSINDLKCYKNIIF